MEEMSDKTKQVTEVKEEPYDKQKILIKTIFFL